MYEAGVRGAQKPQNRAEIRQKIASDFFPNTKQHVHRRHNMKAAVSKTSMLR